MHACEVAARASHLRKLAGRTQTVTSGGFRVLRFNAVLAPEEVRQMLLMEHSFFL